jgi:hypothetical protein
MVLNNSTMYLKQEKDLYFLNKDLCIVEFETPFDNKLLAPVTDRESVYVVGDIKICCLVSLLYRCSSGCLF